MSSSSFNDTIDHLHIELTRIFKDTHDYRERYTRAPAITWSWVATSTAHIMKIYPTGLTDAILLADLETMWEQHCLLLTNQKFDTISTKYDLDAREESLFLDCRITHLVYKHDTIWLATLKDADSYRELDMYLPMKCNPWFQTPSPISPFLHDFGHHRHVRFRCPPRINTPLISTNHYSNTALPRSDRILCCPPTHDCIWQLTADDRDWIKDVFWRDTFATVIPPDSMVVTKKQHRLWVKVIHVEKDNNNNNHQKRHYQQRRTRRDIYVVDRSDDTEPALLSLYDHQTDLTRMIQRGDYLGLYDPVVVAANQFTPSQEHETDVVFECGPDTMLFLMQPHEANQAGVTKVAPMDSEPSIMTTPPDHSDDDDGAPPSSPMRDFFSGKPTKRKQHTPIMARDDEGLMDCLTYVPRIKICDLEPSMSNITLSCRVIAKANNNPFVATQDGGGTQRMDRYAIRIEDESGKVDVTLWEQTGTEAKKLRVGERLVLTGLSTSNKHQSEHGKAAWYVNGSALGGTMIYNVSQCECLLVSHGFGTMTPLYTIQGDGQWETQATIVGWKLRGWDPTQPALCAHDTVLDDDDDAFCLGDYMVVKAHVDCMEIVQENGQCDYCAKEINKEEKVWMYRQRKQVLESESVTQIGWIEWRLDDGHGTLDTYGAEVTILDCSADEFKTLSPKLQIELLDSVVGTQWSCSISCVGTRGYRLDRVAPERQLQSRCISLVRAMSDLLL